ncbi:hypothetical protein AAVH_11014 [Aphelenchoides avenae]|nr:hypothetical protein AAVH_11014 [Aphelenchus avenae]
MARVRIRVLLLITANLPLLYAELSRTAEPSAISGRDKAKPASCDKDCENRTRKRSPQGAKCELYYFAPTAKDGKLFAIWNNTKLEQLLAYRKIVPFLQENQHEETPIFFPAHLPLPEKRKNGEALVLKDVYVRAYGTCDNMEAYDPGYDATKPGWYDNVDLPLKTQVEMVEDYVERMPRSHWGHRVPKAGETDVCLDDTGLVVKEFPGIRTCFSMWIYDEWNRNSKPKHFAGRQIYNRINQAPAVSIAEIGFDPSIGLSSVEPIGTELFSLPALFLKEMCHVTNASLENRCTYWATEYFYVSLCCCYTNRTDCAYKTFKFPSQQKADDPVIRACATGDYYLLKSYGGNRQPKNASGIASSVKEFVQERTSSEICKWTYIWDPRHKTKLSRVLRVELDAERPEAFTQWVQDCTLETLHKKGRCCQRTTTQCPLDPKQATNEIAVECFCRDGDLCNKRHSSLDKDVELFRNLSRLFKVARPCETHTVLEHLLWGTIMHKKPNTSETTGYMCPVFYNFAHPGRPNTFLQLLNKNNFEFGDELDWNELHLILLCAVEGNPLGERRPSYPDAELKKTIEANLTAAKEAFPVCKNDFQSLDFESLSELVVDNSKLERLYDKLTDGTNGIVLVASGFHSHFPDNITTVHCYVEVSFVYQQQYNFTFGAVSIGNKSLLASCYESEDSDKCVRWNSTADDHQQRFACCCRRGWDKKKNICRKHLIRRLKKLLNENAIAKNPEEIMSELRKDPLRKCVKPEKANEEHTGTDVNRPCARKEGCYTGVHARDVPTSTQYKEYGGCVSEYATDAKQRDDKASNKVEARFSRICQLARNQDQCFAVLGTEDAALPEDVKGPQMVCCCGGRVKTAQECSTEHQFGMKIGDFD